MLNRAIRIAVPLLLAAVFSGCATYRNTSQVQDGPGLEFKADELKTFAENQTKVLAELQAMAGVTPGADGTGWDTVISAGMDFADSKCEAYMHALFRLNRDRKTVTSQIGLLGTATAGLMAAAESAARDVAAVAVLFGLSSATVDNLSSNLLYDLDPSSVRTLVKTLQSQFRSNLGEGYKTRPAALRVIRAYAMLCVPANIEAEINLAVKASSPFASPGEPATGKAPEVSNAESSVSVSVVQSKPDDNSALLKAFVFPKGKLNTPNRIKLEAFMRSKEIETDVFSFMQGGKFAAQRAEAVTTLNLK